MLYNRQDALDGIHRIERLVEIFFPFPPPEKKPWRRTRSGFFPREEAMDLCRELSAYLSRLPA